MTVSRARLSGKNDLPGRIPEANIVSCYACHGPNAEGVRDIPRLGGLAYFYLKGRLEQWGQGYHSGTSARCRWWRAISAQGKSRRLPLI